MMRILLLGNQGQLGWELHRCLLPLGDIQGIDYPSIDLSQSEAVRKMIRTLNPHLIVNATAYTAVDRAESELEKAYAINAVAPGVLAEEAQELGAGLIHFSTDYVFDGKKGTPYLETDLPNPLSVYGKSKLMGERVVQDIGGSYLIFRTAWVYSLRRESFVTKVLRWARQSEILRIVDDQISNPTWARMLAEWTAHVLTKGQNDPLGYMADNNGLYHLAGGGYASRFEWASEIIRLASANESLQSLIIKPVDSDQFPVLAKRPLFSALDCSLFSRTFELHMEPWSRILALAMNTQ